MNDYIKGQLETLEQLAEVLPEVRDTEIYREVMEELPSDHLTHDYIREQMQAHGLQAELELLGGGLVGVRIPLRGTLWGLITADYGLGIYDDQSNGEPFDGLRFSDMADTLSNSNKLKFMAYFCHYYG